MIDGLYRGVTGLLEPLVTPFLSPDRREPLPGLDGGCWFHAASAGEVRGLVTLVRALAAARPALLTAQTRAGVAAAHRLMPDIAVRRARLDFPRVSRRSVAAAGAGLYVVTETELWPGLFAALDRAGTPRVLVNARISDRTIDRYRGVRGVLHPLLAGFRLVAAQSERDAGRLLELGADPAAVRVTGNMKHDLPADAGARPVLPWGDEPLIVLGSVRPGESGLLAAALGPLLVEDPALRLVVAPRHAAVRDEVTRAFGRVGFPPAWRSAGAPCVTDRVLGLDSMGELAGFFAAARVAFVGGTLRDFGGHNLLEPAALGVPVVHGPHVANCRLEAEALASTGGAVVAADSAALGAVFRHWLRDEASCATAGAAAREAVARLSGATAKVLAELEGRGLLLSFHGARDRP